jgi:alkanesulfonate monooxygenase SsuD/methylene tetrahydromethanopterin reductase-like flavin-dependent oxidoreductase (luciferase family)
MDRRVARFNEAIDVMKALWTKPAADYHGEFYDVEKAFALKPVQKPYPPIWLGGAHPSAIQRAARVADGWMAAGGQSKATLQEAVPILHEALLKQGKDPATFPVSKRVFLSVHEDPAIAREELLGWFTNVYGVPEAMNTHGFHGTPEQAREYIEEARSLGLNHLLLNPIARTEEQLEALAEVVGLA